MAEAMETGSDDKGVNLKSRSGSKSTTREHHNSGGFLRDPEVAYEHAIFGLSHFKLDVQRFWEKIYPVTWQFNPIQVSVKEETYQ